MKIFSLVNEQNLPVTIEAAWDFFSLPSNLGQITPPEVKFETLTDTGDTRIHNGMKIKYRLRPLLNIPVSWETEITDVQAPAQFTDKQLNGPYALWEHTHTFTPIAGGVKMTDDVCYALPLGLLGQAAHVLIVKRQLDDIFRYRRLAIERFFGVYKKPI